MCKNINEVVEKVEKRVQYNLKGNENYINNLYYVQCYRL